MLLHPSKTELLMVGEKRKNYPRAWLPSDCRMREGGLYFCGPLLSCFLAIFSVVQQWKCPLARLVTPASDGGAVRKHQPQALLMLGPRSWELLSIELWFFAFSVWKWVDNQAGPGSGGWPRGWTVQDSAGETVSLTKHVEALFHSSVSYFSNAETL